MKLVVAVSGGVDSVVLLDKLVDAKKHSLIVAHFDHGMREGSSADARFVERLANGYGLEYVMVREELGQANEDQARERRYKFLFEVAEQNQARLVTAHHLDDLVETVVLNIQRGTGWRGLAVMGDERIWRPLLKRTKRELENYAVERRLEWSEDETNRQNIYARNRIRHATVGLPLSLKMQVYDLWQKQAILRKQIGDEAGFFEGFVSNRYFMTMIDQPVARELLYRNVLKRFNVSLLGRQLDNLLLAIRVGLPGKTWQIGQGVVVKLTARDATMSRDVSLLKG